MLHFDACKLDKNISKKFEAITLLRLGIINLTLDIFFSQIFNLIWNLLRKEKYFMTVKFKCLRKNEIIKNTYS